MGRKRGKRGKRSARTPIQRGQAGRDATALQQARRAMRELVPLRVTQQRCVSFVAAKAFPTLSSDAPASAYVLVSTETPAVCADGDIRHVRAKTCIDAVWVHARHSALVSVSSQFLALVTRQLAIRFTRSLGGNVVHTRVRCFQFATLGDAKPTLHASLLRVIVEAAKCESTFLLAADVHLYTMLLGLGVADELGWLFPWNRDAVIRFFSDLPRNVISFETTLGLNLKA